MEINRPAEGQQLTTPPVTTHLVTCLERLLSMPASPDNDALLLSALDLLQGMLLLHPPSRALFSRETHITVRRP
jgi:hypothetical protein